MLTLITRIVRAPRNLLRRLYDWTIHWSRTKRALYALYFIAFVESSFFPIPPDALLIPMVVGDRRKWLVIAFVCFLGSLSGAVLGYAIGWLVYESIGKAIVDFYNLHHAMDMIGDRYADNAFLTVLAAAFTPIPFKVITISAGLFKISLAVLLFASALGRGGRFFLVAALLRIFGKKISDTLEKYFDLFSLLFFLLLIGGFLAIKYLR